MSLDLSKADPTRKPNPTRKFWVSTRKFKPVTQFQPDPIEIRTRWVRPEPIGSDPIFYSLNYITIYKICFRKLYYKLCFYAPYNCIFFHLLFRMFSHNFPDSKQHRYEAGHTSNHITDRFSSEHTIYTHIKHIWQQIC